jgi:Ca-activated chloride channel family protein
MVEFEHPDRLLLLPLAALLLVAWLRQSQRALRHSDLRLFDPLPSGRAIRARWGVPLLRAAVVFLLLLGLANPRWPDRRTRLPTEGIAVVMVLDVSPTMAEPDFEWEPNQPRISRLDAAKRAFRLFVEGGEGPDGTRFAGRTTDLIGLVTFARWPITACPLTLSHSVLLQILEGQKKATVFDASTNVGDAIAAGLIELEKAGSRRKVMILLSDGQHEVRAEDETGGPKSDDSGKSPLFPRQAAQLAANLRVPIYAVDPGGPIDPDPQGSDAVKKAEDRRAGKRVLRSVTDMTGGRTFDADDGRGMLAVYRAIDALEREPTLSFRYRRYVDTRPWLALGALGLLVVGQFAERVWWRRVP